MRKFKLMAALVTIAAVIGAASPAFASSSWQ